MMSAMRCGACIARRLRRVDRRLRLRRAFDSHRQLDDEDTSLTRQVVEADISVVDLDGLSSDRETQAEAGFVGLTPAGKWPENYVGRIGDAAALVSTSMRTCSP